MSDDNQPEAPDQATVTPTEAEKPEQERTFSAKEVEAIVKDRLARAKREPKPEQKAQPKKEEASAPSDDLSSIKERLAFQDALDDLTDGLDWKPSKEDRALLRSMFKAGGAEQMAALAERLKAGGNGPASSAAPAVASPPGKPYVEPKGAPNSPADVVEENPTKWSRSYIDRLKAEGTFTKKLEAYYGSGQGGLFRKPIPNVR